MGTEKLLEKKETPKKIYATYWIDTAPIIQSKEHYGYFILEEIKELEKNRYVFNLKIDRK